MVLEILKKISKSFNLLEEFISLDQFLCFFWVYPNDNYCFFFIIFYLHLHLCKFSSFFSLFLYFANYVFQRGLKLIENLNGFFF